MDGAQSSVGQANLVGWARAKSPTSKHYSIPVAMFTSAISLQSDQNPFNKRFQLYMGANKGGPVYDVLICASSF